MVLLGRFELPTSSLPMKCSTPELQQHLNEMAHATRRLLWQAILTWQIDQTCLLSLSGFCPPFAVKMIMEIGEFDR